MAKKTKAKKPQGVVAAKLAASFDALAQQIQDADCREGRDAQKAACLAKLHQSRAMIGEFTVDAE